MTDNHYWLDESHTIDNALAAEDRHAQAQLADEREQMTIAAIWHACMLGLPEDECRLLCAETGVQWLDVTRYTQPALRMDNDVMDHVCIGDCPF